MCIPTQCAQPTACRAIPLYSPKQHPGILKRSFDVSNYVKRRRNDQPANPEGVLYHRQGCKPLYNRTADKPNPEGVDTLMS